MDGEYGHARWQQQHPSNARQPAQNGAHQYNAHPQHQQYQPQHGAYAQNPHAGANSVVQDAQRLLAVYPFASATPTSHVARHLSDLTIAAQTPSFLESVTVNNGGRYGETLAQLMSNDPGNGNAEVWRREGERAIALLNEQESEMYTHPIQPLPQPDWQHTPPLAYQNYTTPPFAHALLNYQHQQSYYYNQNIPLALPESSSLAHALDPVVLPPVPPPRPYPVAPPSPTKKQKEVEKEDPAKFFNDFLEDTYAKINGGGPETNGDAKSGNEPPRSVRSESTSALPAVPRTMQNGSLETLGASTVKRELSQHKEMTPSSSPDPLLNSSPLTPLKRKSTSQLQSPIIKRSSSSLSSLSSLTPDSTPSTAATSSTIRQQPLSPTPSMSQSGSPLSLKRKVISFVEIPIRKPFSTPSPLKHRRDVVPGSDGDLGGFGSVYTSPTSASGVRHSTGLRDERQPLEKFTTLLEDIFEAEDALDPSSSDPNPNPEFFSHLSPSCSTPHLSMGTLAKLNKAIRKVTLATISARGSRVSYAVSKSPPNSGVGKKGGWGMREVDVGNLARLLKILERSVKAAEDVDVGALFPKTTTTSAAGGDERMDKEKIKTSPTKSKKAAAKDDMELDVEELTEEERTRLDTRLELLREGMASAECVVALLASDHLPKQVYSEELITSCLTCLTNSLSTLIYPIMEAFSPPSLNTPHHSTSLVHAITTSMTGLRLRVEQIYISATALIPLFNTLVSQIQMAMSDGIVIPLVYISIGPFFVADPSGGGDEAKRAKQKKASGPTVDSIFDRAGPMKGLRLDALSLLRNIFAHHPEQRSWIIEEILTSLIRLPDVKHKGSQFRLRDGHSIHIVSALLLQLIQTAAHDVRLQAQKLSAKRQETAVLKRQDSTLSEAATADTSSLTDLDYEEIQMYSSGLDSASKAARTIVLFLTRRSGKGKSAKSSNDTEYRAIFDNLISDLLTVLHWPEWPASSFVLNIITRFMTTSVDDSKSNAEVNALKALALDHLGTISAKLRQSALRARQPDGDGVAPFHSWEELVARGELSALKRLIKVRVEISSHLSKRAGEDQAYDSARELTAATWGQRMALTLRDLQSMQSEYEEKGNAQDAQKSRDMLCMIRAALRDVWQEGPVDVFDVGSSKEVSRVDVLTERVGASQNLVGLADAVLNVVLTASDSTVVNLRTKALRALGQIVTSDPEVLRNPKVRRSIEGHLLDSSPAVRDATVELVGKYIVSSPELADEYYERVADRIADTGLGVRKRVIKLLKTLFDLTSDLSRRADISARLALRMYDEDDTVKDLAVKTIEELWFSDARDDAVRSKSSATPPTEYDIKVAFSAKVSVIMATVAKLKDRGVMDDLLHAVVAEKPGKDTAAIQCRYSDINDAFIDSLVDASDVPEQNVASCIKAIQVFTTANPSIISSVKASMLLPYLKSAQTPEEFLICDSLLKIFQVCIPRMPKTATKFAQELQQALQPMILKPTMSGGISTLQESIGCMCAVVHHLTRDYKGLVGLLKSCNNRLRDSLRKPDDDLKTPANLRAIFGVISIVALLVEHCDFDQLRQDRTEYAADLDTLTKGSITEYVYAALLEFYEKFTEHTLKNRIIPCLGFLFKAYPSLMTHEKSAEVMDAIFTSDEVEARAQLLRIMNSFLMSEMAKHTSAENSSQTQKRTVKDVNMEELVGNTQGFADSGVSSAIIQRYLNHILEAATSIHMSEQAPAFDLLSIIVKQGLAHPLQSMPVIVSLETSPVSRVSSRASALHSVLHLKHASLVNSRFLECARASFKYQRKITRGGLLQGFHTSPDIKALLHPWYSLVRDKRSSRQDFLKAIVKAFEPATAAMSTSQEDVDFTRYMAENVAALDYKTLEEVLTVIRHLTSVLSISGMQIMELYFPNALDQLKIDDPPQKDTEMATSSPLSSPPPQNQPVEGVEEMSEATPPQISRARTAIVTGIMLLLKSYLKQLYSLSEDKCVKWVPGKKSALGDKAAVKKITDPISWHRLSFATAVIITEHDVAAQREQFIKIWQEDGVTAEPNSDFEE